MFDLNICMQIESERDFPALRERLKKWKKQFPMFSHDVACIENILEKHIQNYSIAGVHYRQTKQHRYIERAQKEIDEINRVLATVEKLELMALLSKR